MSIQRLYAKELLTFDKIELEFDAGLVVLSGPSGAGKSVLMQSVLSSFGYTASEAALCEVSLERPLILKSESFELDDELIVRILKKDRIRYYLNEQNISKKALSQLFQNHIQYLSVRDKSGFESQTLLGLIDSGLTLQNASYKKLLKEYRNRFAQYIHKKNELEKIKSDEKKLAELIEFATYEIEKIQSINPKIGEDEKLLEIKQQLSKIDKINDALGYAQEIFGMEEAVYDVFRLLGKDIEYFSDTMNQLRADFEETQQLTEELADIDVEEVLDRLEKISELKNRYGSISQSLEYLANKRLELEKYQNIEQDKSMLESFLSLEYAELMILAQRISQSRQKEAKVLEKKLKEYLVNLKLSNVVFDFSSIDLSNNGIDTLNLMMGNSSADTLSGGEFNRLRLALLVITIEQKSDNSGVIILDEIDANVSGDESIAIASMIAKLSSVYQIFAISHQAHLAALANQHILITKQKNKSTAKVLNEEERVAEITRIVGGEKPNKEAIAFATELRARAQKERNDS